jgi:hypothetical protein
MIMESVVSVMAGVIIHRTGRYLEIIRFGIAGTALGTGLYINLDTDSSLPKIILFQIATGFGTGMLFFPPLIALQANISQVDTASATATFGFIRNLATAASIVVGGVVFQNSMTLRIPVLRAAGLSANETDLRPVTAKGRQGCLCVESAQHVDSIYVYRSCGSRGVCFYNQTAFEQGTYRDKDWPQREHGAETGSLLRFHTMIQLLCVKDLHLDMAYISDMKTVCIYGTSNVVEKRIIPLRSLEHSNTLFSVHNV